MADDARVNMVWPKGLKERVKEKTGPRGLTEFVLEAVELHLGGADDLHTTQDELNQTKYLAQLLADRIVMGGSSVDRLEAFMELELPSWLDTSGWPSEMAKRVPGEPLEPDPVPAEAIPVQEEQPVDEAPAPEVPAEMEPGGRPEWVQSVEEKQSSPPWSPKTDSKDDLFAKVMAATGGDPLMEKIKPASQVPVPEPKTTDLELAESGAPCPICGDELVGDECWTCG